MVKPYEQTLTIQFKWNVKYSGNPQKGYVSMMTAQIKYLQKASMQGMDFQTDQAHFATKIRVTEGSIFIYQ